MTITKTIATEAIKAIQSQLRAMGLYTAEIDGLWGPRSQKALDALVHGRFEDKASPSKYSERFVRFMPFILKWEGEYYENDPDDPGGATKYGIDQRSHPNVNIRYLTKEGAYEIYWDEWNKGRCESMPFPMGEVFFNCAVNMGLGRAREFRDKSSSSDAFLDLQEAYYRRLGQQPKRAKYLKGWLNRTQDLRKFIS